MSVTFEGRTLVLISDEQDSVTYVFQDGDEEVHVTYVIGEDEPRIERRKLEDSDEEEDGE